MKLPSFKSNKVFYISLGLFLLARIPSLFEPHWYVDEGIYATVGFAINKGLTLYRDVYDHKPQLVFYLYALLGDENILLKAKLLNIVLGMISLSGIYVFASRFFNKKMAAWSVLIAAFILGTPLFEGNIANAESFYLPLIIWGGYLALTGGTKNRLIAGLLFGLSFLIKFHPILDLIAIVFFILAIGLQKKQLKKTIKELLPLAAGFIIPFLLAVLFELLRNNLLPFINAAFLDAYLYSGADKTADNFLIDLIHGTIFKTVATLITVGVIARLYFKKKISKEIMLIGFITAFEFYAIVLSGRAFYHYFLQGTLCFSLLLAYLLTENFIGKEFEEKAKTTFIVIISIILVSVYFDSFHKVDYRNPNRRLPDNFFAFEYYLNFGEHLLSNSIGDEKYNLFFSDREKQLQELAPIRKMKYEKAFIYSDLAWDYSYYGIVPPTKIFVAFQQFYKTDGSDKKFTLDDLLAKKVDLIAVDSTRESYDKFNDFLRDHYRYFSKSGRYSFYKLQPTGN